MNNVEIILKNLGFSPNEARIYLASLEMGVASAQDIALKAEIIRTTAYSVLENLALRGIVIKTKEENKNRYYAESPKNLIKRLERFQNQLQAALPELQAIYNKHETKPKIVFYEGLEGLKRIYADTIKTGPKEILEYNTSNMFEIFPDLPEEYLSERKKYKIKAKRIAPDDPNWKKHAKMDAEELSSTILLPSNEFSIPDEINIYGNKVAFISYSDRIGIIIEGEGIAKTMKKIYDLLWQNLKKSKDI
jgi:sugar-specific transcriptional regulator TrmB